MQLNVKSFLTKNSNRMILSHINHNDILLFDCKVAIIMEMHYLQTSLTSYVPFSFCLETERVILLN